MLDWQQLSANEVPDWIRRTAQRMGKSLPVFRLEIRERRADEYSWREIGPGKAEQRRHPGSDILEMRMSERSLRELPGFDRRSGLSRQREFLFQSVFRDLALEEDTRDFQIVDLQSDTIAVSAQSLLPDVENMPVIGPGGRVTIYGANHLEAGSPETEIAVSADLVLRHRNKPGIPTRWRDVNELAGSIRQKTNERSIGARIIESSVQFGYFELSKYDRQELLRPVIMISLLLNFIDDDRIKWGELIIEPATERKNLNLVEGLGIWAD